MHVPKTYLYEERDSPGNLEEENHSRRHSENK